MHKSQTIEKNNVQNIIGLSPVQLGMLFHYLEDEESNLYYEQLTLELKGNIERELFEQAWNHVVAANEVLRTVFRWDRLDTPLQIILKEHTLKINYLDLSSFLNRQETLDQIVAKDKAEVFDLRMVPFRITLCKLEKEKYIMLMSNHHIILDGWSTGIVLKEFFEAYDHMMDKVELVQPAKTEFKEFVKVIQQAEEGVLEYWKPYLDDFETKKIVPLNQNIKEIGPIKDHTFLLSNEMNSKLKRFIKEERITLATLIYTAWGILLHKYMNSNDLIFGTTVSGRNVDIPGIENMVGLFINTLPLRLKIITDEDILCLLHKVQASLQEREHYEHTSLTELKRFTGTESINDLFDTVVVIENYPLDTIFTQQKNSHLEITSYQISERTNYHITLNVIDGETIKGSINANEKVYDGEFIHRMVTHFENILTHIVHSKGSLLLPSLQILSSAETQQIINGFNDTKTDYPSDQTVHQLFETQASRTPEQVAVIVDRLNTQQTLSYRQLNDKANQLARVLRVKGICNDQIVGIISERSAEMVIGILAILKAGGAYLPIDPNCPTERLQYMIEDSKTRLVLAQKPFIDNVVFAGDLINLDDENLYSVEDSNVMNINQPTDLAYIIYTSGSTGKPKGTMIEHHSLVNRLNWMQKICPIGVEDTILQKTPYTFDVSVWELLWWSLNGAQVCMLYPGAEKDPGALVNAIEKYRVTTIHFVPSMLNAFLEYVEASNDTQRVKSLKQVFASGEALGAKQVSCFNRLLHETNQTELFNLYGPTEATIDVSYFACSGDRQLEDIPIGKPIDNINLYIMDANMQLQPIGVPGELCIGGVGLARGYLHQPELTAARFVDNPFTSGTKMYRTGDLARWLPDGNIQFLGRIDHQVKIRGYRIELSEIESHLHAHEAIQEVVVVARQGVNSDSYLCAYFLAKEEITATELQEFLKKKLPGYMMPAYFVQLDQMPFTTNGKINRRALPEPSIESMRTTEYLAPRNELESQLAIIWENVLEVQKLGVRDNFFNSGGDSIRAIRLVSRMNKAFDTDLTIAELYENENIAKMAQQIKHLERHSDPRIRDEIVQQIGELKDSILTEHPIENVEDIYPMSAIEKGMLFYYLKDPTRSVYYEQFVFQLKYKNFDVITFTKAMELLVEKHPILRTSLNMNDFKEPVQIVHKALPKDIKHYDISGMDFVKQQEYLKSFLAEDRREPFEIRTGQPLWKLRTFYIDDEQISILLVCHHAILDGWSGNLLMIELHKTYLALFKNPDFVPEPLAITYKDSVIGELIDSKKPETIEYWQKELQDYRRLELDIRLTGHRSKEVKRITEVYELDRTLYNDLQQTAKQYNISLKNLCFAAYLYLLKMISGEDDIVVGFLTNNRPIHVEGDQLLGCFLNTVPVRLQIPSLLSWKELIQLVDRKLLEVKRFERIPLFEIVKLIREKDNHTNPLFDTLFNFMDFHSLVEMGKDVINNSFDIEGHQDTNTLFDFMLNTTSGHFVLTLRYFSSIFTEGVTERLNQYFVRILKMLIGHPEERIRKEDILLNEELHLLVSEFNQTKADYSQNITMHELFEKQVARTPNQMAVSFDGEEVTYDELNQRANRLARLLTAKGVQRGTLVAIIIDRSVEMICGVIGILKAGGSYVPLEPYLPDSRIITILSSLRVNTVLTNQRQLARIQKLGAQLPTLSSIVCLDEPQDANGGQSPCEIIWPRDLAELSGENLMPIAEPEDIAYIIFTSGSTGTPKGVVVQHKPVVNVIEWVNRTFHVGVGDKMIFITSLSFDLSVYDIFGILAAGATIRLVSSEDIKEPKRLLNIIMDEGITFWDSTPPALQQLTPFFDEVVHQESKLRLVFLSGDWIPVAMPGMLQQTFKGVQVVSLGGATEATIWSNYFLIDQVDPTWVSIPYGRPIQNAKYYILDKELHLCPIGVPGDLYIGGECLASGYMNDLELTNSKFIPNPMVQNELMYKTGDIARMFADGNMEFLGRKDFQVKVRGYRIEMGEIENQILRHKNIKEAVVIAQGETRDKYLCAYFVAEQKIENSELRELIVQELPDYMIPTYFKQLDKMPLTPNGKLDKKALPIINGVTLADAQYEAPCTEIEKTLVNIWNNVLAIDQPISINDNFFDLGGNSLNVTVIVAKIQKEFNVEIPLQEFFRIPTIKELATYIANAERNQKTVVEIPVAEKREYYPLSSAQTRIFILNQLDKTSTNYNATVVLELEGKLNQEKFTAAWNQLMMRQEALRTSFQIIKGEPAQIIHHEVELKIESIVCFDAEKSQLQKKIKEFIRPFDLSKAPLFRIGLIQRALESYLVIIDMQHIISDGASLGVLVKDFIQLYEGNELPSLRIQYKDYAIWQKQMLATVDVKNQEKYWLERLKGRLPVLQLPTDYPRPQVKSFEGHRIPFTIDQGLTERLNTLAKEHQSTLFMVLLTAYYILLHKYSGQEDIIVGTAIANRQDDDLRLLIGDFVNTLAMRNYPTKSKLFREFLLEVRETALAGYANQDYPLDLLVEKLREERDPSRNPIFDTLFILQNMEIPTIKTGDFALTPFEFEDTTSKFDLFLEVWEVEDGLRCRFEYCSKLFAQDTIAMMASHYVAILSQIVAQPDQKISQIDVVPDPRRLQHEQKRQKASSQVVITKDDIAWFAHLSHDVNPLHTDFDYARKTQFGTCIAYAVLGVLKMFKTYFADCQQGIYLQQIQCQFKAPLYMDRSYTVECRQADDGTVTLLLTDGETVLIESQCTYQVVDRRQYHLKYENLSFEKMASELTDQQLESLQLEGEYNLDLHTVEQMEDKGWDFLVQEQLTTLVWTSYFVGMKAPGKQALFVGLNIDFNPERLAMECSSPNISYQVNTQEYDADLGSLTVVGTVNTNYQRIGTIEIQSFVRPNSIHPTITEMIGEKEGLQPGNSFAGQVVVITGASRGLGAYLALMFAIQGAKVVINYLSSTKEARRVQQEIEQFGGEAVILQADVSKEEECVLLLEETRKHFGKVNLVVNNASPYIWKRSLTQTALTSFKTDLLLSTSMVFNISKTFMDELSKEQGTMLTISSDFVEHPEEGFAGYVAAKSAVEGLIQVLAKEYPNVKQLIVRPKRFLSDQTNSNVSKNYLSSPVGLLPEIYTLIRNCQHSAENFQIHTVGHIDSSQIICREDEKNHIELAVSSTFTSEPIENYIRWWGRKFGREITITFAPYNQVFQQLLDDNSVISRNTGINLLLIRFEDWIRDNDSSASHKIANLKENFAQLLEILKSRKHSTPYFVAVFPISTHLGLDEVIVNHLLQMNRSLRDELAKMENNYLIDFTELQEHYQIENVFDLHKDKAGHMPFTHEFYACMGTMIARKIFALTNQQFKVIAVDADNTLWKGICGEEGALGVRIEKPYLALQKFLLEKYNEGMVLALCSKNNEADLWEVFEKNTGMLLKKDHFASWKINWQPKYQNLRAIAEELNLGMDSFIFIDDSAAEITEVMANCPEVLALRLPENPEDIPAFLQHIWAFDHLNITEEDKKRNMMYVNERKRQAIKQSGLSLQDFLTNLELEVSMDLINESQIPRVSQLTLRTNQFNLSTIRRSEEEIRALMEDPEICCWTIEVKDRFGVYGLVGTVITQKQEENLLIDTFLLSCRVLGRNVEAIILAGLKKYCEEQKLKALIADYYPTAKNQPFLEFVQKYNWQKKVDHDNRTTYMLSLEEITEPVNYIKFYYKKSFSFKETLAKEEEPIVLDHIGVATADLEIGIQTYRSLGYRIGAIIEDPLQYSKMVMCSRDHYDPIELVAPVSEESPTYRIIEKNGDIPYHLCYRVKNVSDFLHRLKEAQFHFDLISDLKPARIFGGKEVMFMYVRDVGLIELLEDPALQPAENIRGHLTTTRIIVINPQQVIAFYQQFGYQQQSSSNLTDHLAILLRKEGAGYIELIVPQNEQCEEYQFFNQNGPHIYQITFDDSKIDSNEPMNDTVTVRCQWLINEGNTEHLLHQEQLLPLKYHTAEMLLTLPVYEVEPPKITQHAKYEEPRNEVEKRLTQIWKEILHIDLIGVTDSFFKLGGTSLAVIQVNSRVNEEFKQDIPVVKMFQYTTIRSLAEYLSQGENLHTSSTAEIERKEVLTKGKEKMKQALLRLRG